MSARPEEEFDPTRVVIRDKRRIDPESGELRQTSAEQQRPPGPGAPAGVDDNGQLAAALSQLQERTADLQRVQADYANYRKRVDRDRVAVVEQATGTVLAALLPVLDDIGRARQHGELEGGFKSVAEALEATTTRLGLERYGAAGEPFDPVVHEALAHHYSPDVTEPTCVEIFQPGYRSRSSGRVLRPAGVVVAEPSAPAQPADQAELADQAAHADQAEPADQADRADSLAAGADA